MQELKQMKIWLLWKWGKDRNGKPTKVPFSAQGGATGCLLYTSPRPRDS